MAYMHISLELHKEHHRLTTPLAVCIQKWTSCNYYRFVFSKGASHEFKQDSIGLVLWRSEIWRWCLVKDLKAPDRKTGSPGMQGRILSLKGICGKRVLGEIIKAGGPEKQHVLILRIKSVKSFLTGTSEVKLLLFQLGL